MLPAVVGCQAFVVVQVKVSQYSSSLEKAFTTWLAIELECAGESPAAPAVRERRGRQVLLPPGGAFVRR